MRIFKFAKLLQKQTVPSRLPSLILSKGFTSLDNIVMSNLPDVTIPTGQITTFIAQKTAHYAGTVALEDGVTGEMITYDELMDKVDKDCIIKCVAVQFDLCMYQLLCCPMMNRKMFGDLTHILIDLRHRKISPQSFLL